MYVYVHMCVYIYIYMYVLHEQLIKEIRQFNQTIQGADTQFSKYVPELESSWKYWTLQTWALISLQPYTLNIVLNVCWLHESFDANTQYSQCVRHEHTHIFLYVYMYSYAYTYEYTYVNIWIYMYI